MVLCLYMELRTGELQVEVEGDVVLAKIGGDMNWNGMLVDCATMGLFPLIVGCPICPTYPILAMWRSLGDGSDDGKGQHSWKISPVDATVEDREVQQYERSVHVSDSGYDLHDQSRSWNSDGWGTLI